MSTGHGFSRKGLIATSKFSAFALGLAAASAFSATANANIIGDDFTNGSSAGQSPATTDSIGPYASTGWYNEYNVGAASGSAQILTDSTNSTTTATIKFTQGGSTDNGGSSYNSAYGAVGSSNSTNTSSQQLYNGAAYAGGGGYVQELTLSNVPYSSYSVYLLVQALPGGNYVSGYGDIQLFNGAGGNPSATPGTEYGFSYENASFNSSVPTPAGPPYTQATATGSGSYTAGANYVLYTGLAADTTYSFDLSSPGVSYNGGAFIDSVEIVDTSSPTPEPASLGLLAIGGVFALSRRRRAKV
jgi:hypothetical protein